MHHDHVAGHAAEQEQEEERADVGAAHAALRVHSDALLDAEYILDFPSEVICKLFGPFALFLVSEKLYGVCIGHDSRLFFSHKFNLTLNLVTII